MSVKRKSIPVGFMIDWEGYHLATAHMSLEQSGEHFKFIIDLARSGGSLEPYPYIGRVLWRTAQRSRIPSSIRRRVLDRYGNRCVKCGCVEDLQMDHKKAWARGGGDNESNLQPLCGPCNRRKWAN